MADKRVKVKFYRAEQRRVRDKPWPNDVFPIGELFRAIADREPTDDRYVKHGDDTFLAKHEQRQPARAPWSLYRVRHDRLPDEERGGLITPLVLDADANLAEGAHMIFFDRNIVGLCGGVASPGRASISGYVEKLLKPTNRSLELTPVLRPDLTPILEHATLVNATIRVAAGNADALAEVNSTLGSAAREIAREASGTSVSITVNAGRSSQERRSFRERYLPTFRRIAAEAPTRVETLRVEYISEEAGRQVVDLLGDDITIVVHADVDPTRRHLPPDAAYEAIRTGYREATEQLNAALELG